jgi:hypothetical protein
MPHITIEYMIMIPLLIMQIFLFPLTANSIMNTWVNSRRTLALQDVAGQLGSTMQQLYYTLNHVTVPAGKVIYSPGLPPSIEDIHYTAHAVLRTIEDIAFNSSRAIDLTVILSGTTNAASNSIILGPNADWHPSIFMSNSTHACVTAQKFSNGTIALWFGE